MHICEHVCVHAVTVHARPSAGLGCAGSLCGLLVKLQEGEGTFTLTKLAGTDLAGAEP